MQLSEMVIDIIVIYDYAYLKERTVTRKDMFVRAL